jgi:hypothetical protein
MRFLRCAWTTGDKEAGAQVSAAWAPARAKKTPVSRFLLCLSGGGGNGFFNQPAQSYVVRVIATDMKTGFAASTNVTLTMQ